MEGRGGQRKMVRLGEKFGWGVASHRLGEEAITGVDGANEQTQNTELLKQMGFCVSNNAHVFPNTPSHSQRYDSPNLLAKQRAAVTPMNPKKGAVE